MVIDTYNINDRLPYVLRSRVHRNVKGTQNPINNMCYFIVADNTILSIKIKHSEFAAYMFLLLFKLEGELSLLSFFALMIYV